LRSDVSGGHRPSDSTCQVNRPVADYYISAQYRLHPEGQGL